MNHIMRSAIDFFIIFFITLCILGVLISDTFLFRPKKSSYQDNDSIIKLKIATGEKIAAKYYPIENAKYTVLINHGNGEDIGTNENFAKTLNKHGLSAITYDYLGYGTSDGKPNEKNSYQAVNAVYEYLINDKKIKPQNIISYGHSLGGALAVYIASTQEVGALVLEGTFVTAFRVMTVWPLLPFDKFRNISRIKNIKVPKLFIHGRKDEVIHFWHGEKLYEVAPEPKINLWIDNGNHNNARLVEPKNYWQKWKDLQNLMDKFDYKY